MSLPLQKLPPQRVRTEIESLLSAELTDAELRERLEQLAGARAFGGFTWLWGPRLYQRNRVLFRPFILSHFSTFLMKPDWSIEQVAWKGDVGRQLDAWFREVESVDDTLLFQKLYPWKHRGNSWGGVDEKRWRADVVECLRRASSPAARAAVFEKFNISGRLDESTAVELYRLAPRFAGPFILGHLEWAWNERRKLWRQLFELAQDQGDPTFAFQLYRRQIDQSSWESDILRLAEEVHSPAELVAELERRHPEGWALQLGMTIFRLVEKRGRDVLPYVQKHLRDIYRTWGGSRDGYGKLVKFAAERGWWDLWSGLVRTCSHPDEYQAEVNRLLQNHSTPESKLRRRLLMLTGISREWNFGPFGLAQVQQLNDDTAVRLYGRFPDLLRGPFKMNISAGWYQSFPKLVEAVIGADDEILIDFLASRMVTRADWGWKSEEVVQVAERFSRYYERFREDDREFSRRAVKVLEQVPAYSVWSYRRVIRTNRLARLFYERSAAKYLAHPTGIRDLLESGEIHAQALAFRVLGLDRSESQALARENLDLLQATLLRPLHRATRGLAFRALENAAIDADSARSIHGKCREALELPDKRYPKEQLVGLIGQLLYRWPELRRPEEQPVIHGATV